jgi:hypothetical protein
MRSTRSWIAGLVVGVGTTGVIAEAAEFHVHEGESIQAAIEQAVDGDVVTVHAGVYNEAIDFLGKGITVRSSQPDMPHLVVLDGTGLNASVVSICELGMKAASVEGLTIRGGSGTPAPNGTKGGAIYISGSGPHILDCVIEENEVSGVGGGVAVQSGWPIVERTVFRNNAADFGGGGLRSSSSSLLFISCQFEDNRAESGSWGGGLHALNGGVVLINTRFTSNHGSYGGGLASVGAKVTAVNCNFVGNSVSSAGGAVLITESITSPPSFANCVFWANEAGNGPKNLFVLNNPDTIVEFSALDDIWAGDGIATNMLIEDDPGFVDPLNGDFSLRSDSVLKDAGENDAFPPSIETDALGNERIVYERIDIGAVEYQDDPEEDPDPDPAPKPDFNDDGWVDHNDLFPLLGAWGEFRSAEDEQYDLDEDGWVDADDLTILLGAWGPVSGQDQVEW